MTFLHDSAIAQPRPDWARYASSMEEVARFNLRDEGALSYRDLSLGPLPPPGFSSYQARLEPRRGNLEKSRAERRAQLLRSLARTKAARVKSSLGPSPLGCLAALTGGPGHSAARETSGSDAVASGDKGKCGGDAEATKDPGRNPDAQAATDSGASTSHSRTSRSEGGGYEPSTGEMPPLSYLDAPCVKRALRGMYFPPRKRWRWLQALGDAEEMASSQQTTASSSGAGGSGSRLLGHNVSGGAAGLEGFDDAGAGLEGFDAAGAGEDSSTPGSPPAQAEGSSVAAVVIGGRRFKGHTATYADKKRRVHGCVEIARDIQAPTRQPICARAGGGGLKRSAPPPPARVPAQQHSTHVHVHAPGRAKRHQALREHGRVEADRDTQAPTHQYCGGKRVASPPPTRVPAQRRSAHVHMHTSGYAKRHQALCEFSIHCEDT